MKGEYWHVRTKISIKSRTLPIIFKDIFGLVDVFHLESEIVDFLNINLQFPDITIDDLDKICNNIMKNHRFQLFEKYFYKYLKYKNKYLNLIK
jgi:predicted nucleic acid-binding protein